MDMHSREQYLETLAKVAVAVLTDSPSPAEKPEVLGLGVQAFRVKPMNLEDTFALARDLIQICKDPAFAS